jgi:predicted permease
LNDAGYNAESGPAMQKRIIDAVNGIPGVTSVGMVDALPLGGGGNFLAVFKDDVVNLTPANAAANAYIFCISPDYLDAAGTRLLTGRTFTWSDDKNAPRVAIVNREFARRLFGSVENATGKYFKSWDGVREQVVGVVVDGKYMSLPENMTPAAYQPLLQAPSNSTSLVARTAERPELLAGTVTKKVREVDAGLPFTVQTWEKGLDGALFPARIAAIALGVLGVMGAMLSVTGIFGVAAYSVSKRKRELGIRMALGARRKEVLKAALGHSFQLLAFGSATGLALGLLASRVLAVIVYQATPRDPLVLSGVVFAMFLLGLLATWVPAQRALSLDPLILLRED